MKLKAVEIKHHNHVEDFLTMWDEYVGYLRGIKPDLNSDDAYTTMSIPETRLILFYLEHEPVGFALIGYGQNKHPLSDYYIEDFFVRDTARGQGFGREMFYYILQEFPGCYCYFTLDGNVGAEAFWEHVFSEREYSSLAITDTSNAPGYLTFHFKAIS